MSFKVIIRADSINEFGNRLTTMEVTFPRIILAEKNTHRALSRNSASSRAIRFLKMLGSVTEKLFIPIAWMKEHTGMQGKEFFESPEDVAWFRSKWLEACDCMAKISKEMSDKGLTKQICNRLLEPFMWHTVLVSATEWENFFALRCPQYWNNIDDSIHRSKKDYLKRRRALRTPYEGEDIGHQQLTASDLPYSEPTDQEWFSLNKGQAEIHMMALAEVMWDAYNESVPKKLLPGEWHIPFGENLLISDISDFLHKAPYKEEVGNFTERAMLLHKEASQARIKIATARCAQVSYTVVGEDEKEMNYEKLIALHDRLLKAGHMSPFEHCAKAMSEAEYRGGFDPEHSCAIQNPTGWSGNFMGWTQYRKMIPGENITKEVQDDN